MKVLVAVLGNYRQYDPVNYELDGEVIECVKSSAEAVKRVKKPDRTFVFLPSTLYHDIVGEPGEGKYSALAEAMLNAVRSDSSFPDPMKQENMYVVPNTGRFKGSKAPGVYEYRERGGDVSFLQNYAFLKLYEALKDVREDLEVYVDMTHGVNYTSFLVSDAVRALVQALVVSANSPPDLKKGVKATVTFYNSDVYVRGTVDYAKCKQGSQAAQGDTAPPPLKVNPVLVETVDSRTAFTALLDQLLSTNKEELRALFGTDTNKVVKLVRAARSGLFLAVSTCKDFLESTLRNVEERLRGLEDCGVKVKKGEITNVTYDCSVPRSTYRVFAALWAIHSAINGKEKEVERGWLLDRVNKYADAVTKAIVESELEPLDPDNLMSNSRIKKGEWYDVSAAKEKSQAQSVSRCVSLKSVGEVDQKDQRNFAAHGGLLKGLACFRLHGEKVYLKYSIEGTNACDEILKYIV